MITNSIIRKITLLALTLLLILPISAQDEFPNLLLEMLAYVPATAAGEFIGYSDYLLALEARPGTPIITNSEEYAGLTSDEVREWGNALPMLFPRYGWLHRNIEETQDTVGIDIFTIQHVVVFGRDDTDRESIVLSGDFDFDRIADALVARDYTLKTADNAQLMCYEGCEYAIQDVVDNRENANPFGGTLGRREPVAFVNNHILSAPTFTTLTDMLSTSTTGSILDVDGFRAIANVLQEQPLRQIAFLPIANVGSPSPTAAFVPTPNAIALADVVILKDEIVQVQIILSFDDEQTALQAESGIQVRLGDSNLRTERWQQSFGSGLISRIGQVQYQILHESRTNQWLLITLWEHPLVHAGDMMENVRGLQPSTYAFILLHGMYLAEEMLWFAPSSNSL